MAKLLKDRYFLVIIALLVFQGIFIFAYDVIKVGWLPPQEEWVLTYVAIERALFLTVVAIAAWRFGFKWGVATCFAVGLIILAHITVEQESPDVWLEAGAVITIGIILSWLISSRKRAEEALGESEERYSTLVNLGGQINEAVVMEQDTEQGEAIQIFVSDAWPHITGYSKEELLGMSFFDLVHPKYRQAVVERHRRRMQGETVAELPEASIIRKDGTEVPIESTGASAIYKGKQAHIAYIRDITKHKQAEEALRGSEEKYRLLFKNVMNGFALHEIVLDKRGKPVDYTFLEVNSAFEQSTNLKRNDIIGKRVTEVIPGIEKDPADWIGKYGKVALTGQEIRFDDYAQSLGKWFSVLAFSHQKGQFATIFEDITERKQAEENLRKAAGEWRATFDSITDLVSIVDKDFKLLRVNKAFASFFNMKPKELIGKTCYKVLHGTGVSRPGCPHKRTMETGKPVTEEYFEPHLGVYLQVSTSPIFNDRGDITGSVHIARDITERKKNEEKLIITDRLASVGELASGIAHELNNPLTSVIGFAHLLLEKDVPDDVREDVEIIHREAQRTAEIVKNLLTFAQKHEPSRSRVNVNDIIAKVLELRAYEQKVNNIRVVTHLAPDLPQVMADYFQLQQVFLNIVINAEHFMIEAHNRGTLTITTERVDNVIRVSFADDGPGISKENLGHLFDPFFTTKEVGKGTGLGLSICHGIIKEHGGQIYAQSEPGQGATFIAEIPITIDKKGTVK